MRTENYFLKPSKLLLMGLCLALLSSTFSCEEFEDTEELVSNDLEGEDEDEAEIEEESELDDDLFTDDGEDESEEALIMHKGKFCFN